VKVGDAHLTYCTNIHPGETWPEVRANLERYVVAVKARVCPDEPFGVGLRLSIDALIELRDSSCRAFADLREFLAENGLYVFTINGFPYGRFHGTSVKESVYRPDWSEEDRVGYTVDLARLLARLLPPGITGTVSTVPGAFHTRARHSRAIATHLKQCNAALAAIERDTDRRVVVALEPEPACMLETVAYALAPSQRLAEPHAEDGDEEGQLQGEDGLDGGQVAEVQRQELEQEGGDHYAEAHEPHSAADGIRQQAEPEDCLLGGRLYAHPLQDGGQGIGERRSHGEHVGHRRFLPYRSGLATVSAGSVRSGTRSGRRPVHARCAWQRDTRGDPGMSDTVHEQEFGGAALAFLEANAEPRVEIEQAWGEGTDHVALLPERTYEEEVADLELARTWAQKRFDAGFGWITGPVEYGGRGLSRNQQRTYDALEVRFAIPPMSVYGIGLGMVAPTILAHGTEEVKQRYLRSLWRGDIVACQLFSEPGAGSDLAGLQSRAVRDGDEWVVTGQKVWTSGAQLSDIGEIICRSDPDAPKHKGLTGFIVDMHAPGVEIRPLRQMTGGSSFNEVFFNEARIPDSHRLGDVNGGWSVALTTLMNERAAIGGGSVSSGSGTLGTERFMDLVRHQGRARDPLVRQRLAEIYINGRVASYTNLRSMAKVQAGQAPGPEMSIAKLSLTANMRRMGELLSEVLGPKLVADSGEWGTYAWAQFMLALPGMTIAGGTDEVLRNIIGERVLGLPKEPAANR
jgi:acyl-CoA dehydrogenase